MPDWITEEEQERIQKFADTPRYKRDPQFLEPEDDGSDAEDDEEEEVLAAGER